MRSATFFEVREVARIQEVETQLQAMRNALQEDIDENIKQSREGWKLIFWKKVDAIIKLRLASIKVDLGSYSEEDQARAVEVASDRERFEAWTDPTIAIIDYQISSGFACDDAMFCNILINRKDLFIARYQAALVSGLDHEGLDKISSNYASLQKRRIGQWIDSREQLYLQVYQDVATQNTQQVRRLETADPEDLDVQCRGGRSLEAFCFDLRDSQDTV